MRIKAQSDLLVINIITGLLVIAIIFVPSNVLRVVLGLPFVLFFPGYTLVAALFPGQSQLTNIERIALSFVLSVVIVPLSGFILDYTPWGIRLYPILIIIAGFIFITSLIAWYRRRRLNEAESFAVSFRLNLSLWRGKNFVDKIMSLVLIFVILGAIGTISYVLAVPRVGEQFTEFYIVGPEGKAEGYPQELLLGEEAQVMVGIVNREHEDVSYRVEVKIDGVRRNTTGSVMLAPGEKWVESIDFTPTRPGDNQKVEFLLYRNGQSEPYLKPLYLWIDVEEGE